MHPGPDNAESTRHLSVDSIALAYACESGQSSNPTQLRSSCDSCANSKIRCSKEKPVCSRCEKRDISCSYSVPRRSGRPAQKKQQKTTNTNDAYSQACSPVTITPEVQHQGQGNGSIEIARAHALHTSPSSSSGATSSVPIALTFDHASPAMSDPTNNTMPFVTDETQPYIFPELWEAPAPFPTYACDPINLSTNLVNDITFGLNSDFSNVGNFYDIANDMALSCSGFNEASPTDKTVPENFTYGTAPTAVMQSSSPSASGPCMLTNIASESSSNLPDVSLTAAQPCQCHHRAIKIMSQATPSVMRQRRPCTGRMSFETVLELGSALEDTISNISECPCEGDIYLLCTLILATYKMLEWFEEASCGDRDSIVIPPSIGIDGNALEGQGVCRIAAQIVLSRLPHVQRTVDCLHRQLQDLGAGAALDCKRNKEGSAECADVLKTDNTHAATLLPMSLAQSLHSTLKQRTLDLAKKVVARLR
jgi:hypothetical protein